VNVPKRTVRAFAVFAAIVGLLTLWEYTPATRGRYCAQFNVWRGHYAVVSYGMLPWRHEYAELLRERYGVELYTVAFCIVSENVRSYADSYNAVSAAAANRKFGHDIFRECMEAARRSWERQRVARTPAD